MNASIRKFLKEEDGVTALEYGLLAAVIGSADRTGQYADPDILQHAL